MLKNCLQPCQLHSSLQWPTQQPEFKNWKNPCGQRCRIGLKHSSRQPSIRLKSSPRVLDPLLGRVSKDKWMEIQFKHSLINQICIFLFVCLIILLQELHLQKPCLVVVAIHGTPLNIIHIVGGFWAVILYHPAWERHWVQCGLA